MKPTPKTLEELLEHQLSEKDFVIGIDGMSLEDWLRKGIAIGFTEVRIE